MPEKMPSLFVTAGQRARRSNLTFRQTPKALEKNSTSGGKILFCRKNRANEQKRTDRFETGAFLPGSGFSNRQKERSDLETLANSEQGKSGGILSALEQYAGQGPARFHMPGHKGFDLPGVFDARFDVTELPGLDSLLCPEGILARAQEEAAAAFGATATFFCTGGSTVGNLAMLLSLPEGSKVLAQRNCHRSVLSGLALGNHRPVWLWPSYENGQYGVIAPETVQAALSAHPDAAAVLLTRPDYFGRCCDGEAVAALCKAHGALLLIDEAHGAHFPFSPALPKSASAFADLWVQSAHKTLCCPNQGSYLHLGHSEKPRMPSRERVARALFFVHTTSPSYPLLAALDGAWRRAGEQDWTLQVARAERVRRRLGAGILSETEKRGAAVAETDRSRLVLDVSKRGITGFAAEEFLRGRGIFLEMADERRIVAITSPVDPDQWYGRLSDGLAALPFGRFAPADEPRFEQPQRAELSLREASLCEGRYVPLSEAVGELAACAVGIYPPGSAVVAPGEAFSPEAVEFLLEQEKKGAALFGLTDGRAAVCGK